MYQRKFASSIVHTNEDHAQDMIDFLNSNAFVDDKGKMTNNISILEKYLLTARLFHRDVYNSQFLEEDEGSNYIMNSIHEFEEAEHVIANLFGQMVATLPSVISEDVIPVDILYPTTIAEAIDLHNPTFLQPYPIAHSSSYYHHYHHSVDPGF